MMLDSFDDSFGEIDHGLSSDAGNVRSSRQSQGSRSSLGRASDFLKKYNYKGGKSSDARASADFSEVSSSSMRRSASSATSDGAMSALDKAQRWLSAAGNKNKSRGSGKLSRSSGLANLRVAPPSPSEEDVIGGMGSRLSPGGNVRDAYDFEISLDASDDFGVSGSSVGDGGRGRRRKKPAVASTKRRRGRDTTSSTQGGSRFDDNDSMSPPTSSDEERRDIRERAAARPQTSNLSSFAKGAEITGPQSQDGPVSTIGKLKSVSWGSSRIHSFGGGDPGEDEIVDDAEDDDEIPDEEVDEYEEDFVEDEEPGVSFMQASPVRHAESLGNVVSASDLLGGGVSTRGSFPVSTSQPFRTATFSKGDKIECRFGGRATWYPGTVDIVNPDGTFDVLYDDGDVEENIRSDLIRLRPINSSETAESGSAADAVAAAVAQAEADERRRREEALATLGRGAAAAHNEDDAQLAEATRAAEEEERQRREEAMAALRSVEPPDVGTNNSGATSAAEARAVAAAVAEDRARLEEAKALATLGPRSEPRGDSDGGSVALPRRGNISSSNRRGPSEQPVNPTTPVRLGHDDDEVSELDESVADDSATLSGSAQRGASVVQPTGSQHQQPTVTFDESGGGGGSTHSRASWGGAAQNRSVVSSNRSFSSVASGYSMDFDEDEEGGGVANGPPHPISTQESPSQPHRPTADSPGSHSNTSRRRRSKVGRNATSSTAAPPQCVAMVSDAAVQCVSTADTGTQANLVVSRSGSVYEMPAVNAGAAHPVLGSLPPPGYPQQTAAQWVGGILMQPTLVNPPPPPTSAASLLSPAYPGAPQGFGIGSSLAYGNTYNTVLAAALGGVIDRAELRDGPPAATSSAPVPPAPMPSAPASETCKASNATPSGQTPLSGAFPAQKASEAWSIPPEAQSALHFNANLVAANNLFRRNLLLIQQQLSVHQQLASSMMDIPANYRYPTLKETMLAVEKERPRVPTMKEALDIVDRRANGELVETL